MIMKGKMKATGIRQASTSFYKILRTLTNEEQTVSNCGEIRRCMQYTKRMLSNAVEHCQILSNVSKICRTF